MEDRLKGLKKSLNNTLFSDLEFSKTHINQIHKAIHEENEEGLFFTILQLLLQEKSGYTLTKEVRARGIEKFEGQEGQLYTMLHQIENDGYVESKWDGNNVKLYRLTSKGKRVLGKYEKQIKEGLSVLDILTEVSYT
jgi:DNA-binding PadR family transcriptional regulator